MHHQQALAGLVLTALLLWLAVAPPAAAQDGGRVYIPRLALAGELVTVPIHARAWDTTVLGDGIGWLDHTNWIDDGWGRVVLAGHADGAFRNLAAVEQGDMVVVWDGDTIVRYEIVSEQVVEVTAIGWILPTTAPTLTLITCAGDARLVVVAHQLD